MEGLEGKLVLWAEWDPNKGTQDPVEVVFLGFGVDYEEFDAGPGMYTTAMIMVGSGDVKNVPVQHIKFKQQVFVALKAVAEAGVEPEQTVSKSEEILSTVIGNIVEAPGKQ